MVLVYEKEPKLAAAIAAALSAAGHEVRQVQSFLSVRDLALGLRPAAVVFQVDQNSVGTYLPLRLALDPDIPVVATGKRRFLNRAFASLRVNGRLQPLARSSPPSRLVPDRFWFVEAPIAPETARDVMQRAISDAPACVPDAVARRRRVFAWTWIALFAAAVLALGAGVLFFLGRPVVLVGAMALLMALFGLGRAYDFRAALRIGLRPPWWSWASLALRALVTAGLLWSALR